MTSPCLTTRTYMQSVSQAFRQKQALQLRLNTRTCVALASTFESDVSVLPSCQDVSCYRSCWNFSAKCIPTLRRQMRVSPTFCSTVALELRSISASISRKPSRFVTLRFAPAGVSAHESGNARCLGRAWVSRVYWLPQVTSDVGLAAVIYRRRLRSQPENVLSGRGHRPMERVEQLSSPRRRSYCCDSAHGSFPR